MATGRTVFQKYARVYVSGYDLSGYARDIGPLTVDFDMETAAAMTDGVKGGLPGHPTINVGTLNGFLDTTATSGLHALAKAATGTKNVMVPIGIRAAPAAGDPCFVAQVEQKNYITPLDLSGAMVNATVEYAGTTAAPTTSLYSKAWGLLLHANSAVTAANTGTGVDYPGAAETTAGGFLMYQVLAGDAGTCTISIDDSANNVDFLALSGATSGEINATAGTSAIVALGTTATVRRYLRWQIALNSALTCTFVLAFVRG